MNLTQKINGEHISSSLNYSFYVSNHQIPSYFTPLDRAQKALSSGLVSLLYRFNLRNRTSQNYVNDSNFCFTSQIYSLSHKKIDDLFLQTKIICLSNNTNQHQPTSLNMAIYSEENIKSVLDLNQSYIVGMNRTEVERLIPALKDFFQDATGKFVVLYSNLII